MLWRRRKGKIRPWLYPRGDTFPAGCGYIRGNFSPVPARRCFSGRLRVYPREFFSCTRAAVFFRPVAGISAGIFLLYPRGGVFPAGCGYIRGNFSPVPARRCFSGRLRVYPREFFSCTRAALLLRPVAGISARFSLLYPRGDAFMAGCGYIRAFFSPVPARRYFYDRLRVYLRKIFSCTRAAVFFRPVTGISAGNLLLYPRGGVFPAGCGYIRAFFSPVPARRCFSGRLRVYPREIFSCTRAAAFFRPVAGIFARFSLLYPRGGVFPAGYGYIRGNFSPVPARPWHKPSVGTLSLGCTRSGC